MMPRHMAMIFTYNTNITNTLVKITTTLVLGNNLNGTT